MSQWRNQEKERWMPARIILVASVMIGIGLWAEVASAQLDLSVFQKEGASEAQQSKDRYECHQFAVRETGVDPAVRPANDYSPMRRKEKEEMEAEQDVEWRKEQIKYMDALKKCMLNRGYRLEEH